MDWPRMVPVALVYAVGCVLFNWGINLLNQAWVDRRQVPTDTLPPEVRDWITRQGLHLYRSCAGHPFTPLLVILGTAWTLGATYVATMDGHYTAGQTLGVCLFFFVIGGLIMTAGDALRYVRYS